jgi:hypothetical protein
MVDFGSTTQLKPTPIPVEEGLSQRRSDAEAPIRFVEKDPQLLHHSVGKGCAAGTAGQFGVRERAAIAAALTGVFRQIRAERTQTTHRR